VGRIGLHDLGRKHKVVRTTRSFERWKYCIGTNVNSASLSKECLVDHAAI
jgi:hypothetical protein